MKRAVLSAVLGMDIRLKRANVGGRKRYKDIYKRVRGEACFKRKFVERIYTTPLVSHLWSEADRAAMIDRWTRQPQPSCDVS